MVVILNGNITSGIYKIFQSNDSRKDVFCDMDTAGGGWTVFQRRQDGSVDFNVPWASYESGFGHVGGEHWLGNRLIHDITTSDQYTLRIDMEDFDGNKAYAQYDSFSIGSVAEQYQLHVDTYSGTAGDSLISCSSQNSYQFHNGMKFSTIDRDNDKTFVHCASNYPGGWWFNRCFCSHLNGVYSSTGRVGSSRGIPWASWRGFEQSLKSVEMKMRPRAFNSDV
jgi:ficolin